PSPRQDLHPLPTRRSSDLQIVAGRPQPAGDDDRVRPGQRRADRLLHPSEVVADDLLVMGVESVLGERGTDEGGVAVHDLTEEQLDRKSTRLNSSHVKISYA